MRVHEAPGPSVAPLPRVQAALAWLRARPAVPVFLLGLLAFAVQSLAWPMTQGRDAGSYLVYWLDFWQADATLPQLQLFRTPGAPLFFGALLDLGGAGLVEAAMGVLYAGALVAWHRVASLWGPRVAAAVVVALLLYPAYGAMFHTIGSDALYAAVLPFWAVAVVRAIERPTTGRWVVVGAGVVVLALVRPSAQAMLVVAVLPLLVPGTGLSWRRRALQGAALAATVLVGIGAWMAVNGLRYGEVVFSRTGNAQTPLYRLFTFDRLVAPENGPATRELAEAVRTDLLPREPYRAYGVTLDEFFRRDLDGRFWNDLIPLTDRRWGWDTDYAKLREVAVEAIRAHPGDYLRGVSDTTWDEMTQPFEQPASVRPATAVAATDPELPAVGPNERIPQSNHWWLASSPDGSIWTDWSDIRAPELRFRDPAMAARWAEVSRRLADYQRDLPARDGRPGVADRLNQVTRAYPSMFLFFVVGLVGSVLMTGRQRVALLATAGLGFLLVAATAAAMPPTLQYRVPVDAAFIVAGVAGAATLLAAGRRRWRARGAEA